MPKPKNSQWTTGKVFAVGLGLMFVAFLVFMGPLQWAYEAYGPEWMRAEPEDLPEGAQRVDVFITQREAIGGAAENQIIRVYDANLAFIEEVTPSSGKATCTQAYWEGETINLQVRPADPNSASYSHYMSPMISVVIPQADVNGDAIIAGPDVWETSTTAVTFSVFDQDYGVVNTEATQYINTTDTKLNIYVSITDDCAFGTPLDFTDEKSGYKYKAGAWLVVSCTEEQQITNYDYLITSPTLFYYIFVAPMGVEDTNNQIDVTLGWTILCPQGFTASADFDFDVFDTCRLGAGDAVTIGSFMDGDSDMQPAALVNKCA